MSTSSVTTQKAELLKPDSSRADIEKSANVGVAFYLNPACEHKWSKLDPVLQTLASEGKTIWKCSTCEEISTTYDWQKPGE